MAQQQAQNVGPRGGSWPFGGMAQSPMSWMGFGGQHAQPQITGVAGSPRALEDALLDAAGRRKTLRRNLKNQRLSTGYEAK